MIGRAERRRTREPRTVAVFGAGVAPAALDLFELLELAWHDCYGDETPPDSVVDDVFTLSDGTLAGLIQASRLAVADPRDLRVAADAVRDRRRS